MSQLTMEDLLCWTEAVLMLMFLSMRISSEPQIR